MRILRYIAAGGILTAVLTLPVTPALADKDDDDHRKGWGKKRVSLRIPPGHRPPPGACRIWYPGKPPGHQPPPGSCRILSHRVPPGAWLITHDGAWSYDEVRRWRYARYKGHYGRPDWYNDDDWRRYHDRRDHDFDRGHTSRREIRKDINTVRKARAEVREDRERLERRLEELKEDRAELRRDIRDGANRKEIRQERREVRRDTEKVAKARDELRESQNKLEAAREELREDLRRR